MTIATYNNYIDAELAKHQLETSGVKAFLADNETATTAWHLTVAVGWIKLKVLQSDVDRAVDILTIPVEPVRENTELEMEDIWDDRDDDISEYLTPAEQLLDRAFRSAVIGLIFFPLQLYSLWLLLRFFLSGMEVSRSRRIKLIATLIFDSFVLFLIWAVFRMF